MGNKSPLPCGRDKDTFLPKQKRSHVPFLYFLVGRIGDNRKVTYFRNKSVLVLVLIYLYEWPMLHVVFVTFFGNYWTPWPKTHVLFCKKNSDGDGIFYLFLTQTKKETRKVFFRVIFCYITWHCWNLGVKAHIYATILFCFDLIIFSSPILL